MLLIFFSELKRFLFLSNFVQSCGCKQNVI